MEKQRILLVEDDVNFGNMLKDTLDFNDYEVTLERDGVQGLRAYKQGTYELCIFDIMMPKKDGLTLAKEIREVNELIPLIFLTAKNLKDDVLNFSRVDDSAVSRSMHGTTRQIVNNMIIGVTEGFKKNLRLLVSVIRPVLKVAD